MPLPERTNPTPALSAWNRALLYLFSTRNIAGCTFALIGLALFFAGVIDRGWWAIAAALYGAGALLFGNNEAAALAARSAMLRGSLLEQLDRLIGTVRKRVPPRAFEHLQAIRATVSDLRPRLDEWADSTGIEFQHAQAVTVAITRDLPQTLSNYLLLPSGFTRVARLEGGRTADTLLIEQLALLEGSLRRIADDALREDAEALIVHGKFLRERFGALSFVDQGRVSRPPD
jgi:hypothetical protein